MIDLKLEFTFFCDECGRKAVVSREWFAVYSRIDAIKPVDYIRDSAGLIVHEDGSILCKDGNHLENDENE